MLRVYIHVVFVAYVLMKRMVDTCMDKYFVVAQEESKLIFFSEYFSLSITVLTFPRIYFSFEYYGCREYESAIF